MSLLEISFIVFTRSSCRSDNGALEAKKSDLGKFLTWSDNPGLVLSYLGATNLPEGELAQQYTLCDNFFCTLRMVVRF